jgi:hypothetical protein
MVILLEEGCLPEQVDKVMVDFGYPMGPFAVGDLAGLDISAAGRRRRAAQNSNYRKLPIADRLVEIGRYGQKTAAGWYRYEKGDRTPHPDPEVARIIKAVAAELGVPQKSFTDEEILRRLLFSSVNEACRILEEGKDLSRQRHRRDVAARLRFPALPRRPDVLGRRQRSQNRLRPDRPLAPAIWRALGALAPAAPARREQHAVPRAEASADGVSAGGIGFRTGFILADGGGATRVGDPHRCPPVRFSRPPR